VLATTGSGDYTYQWTPANHLSNPFIQNPAASPLSNTQYTVTAKNDQGCASETSVNISLKSSPVLKVFGDTTICSSSDVQLIATSPGNTTFSWQPNNNLNNPAIANPIASPVETTLYTVTVTSNNNCSATDSVLVQVYPKPVFSINPKQSKICKGDSIILAVSGGDQYQWAPAATVLNPASGSTPVFPDVDTHYDVFVTDNKCGVSETLEAVVTIQPKAKINITKSNDINCILGQATLSATGGVSYHWEPLTGLSDPTLSSTLASPEETTIYYLQTTSNNGCVSKDSIELIVSKGYDEKSYQLATGFTPNNDGLNDCFGVAKWGYITSLEFSIFNRFGERVFFTKDPSLCWDGKYKGSPQDSGVFVYLIKAKGICGQFTRRGTVVLMR
jgi:gliding motility-associated-like protein